MPKYDFDKLIDRRGTNSLKWDVAEGELRVVVRTEELQAAGGVLDDDRFLRSIVLETAVGNAAEIAHDRTLDQGRIRDLHV